MAVNNAILLVEDNADDEVLMLRAMHGRVVGASVTVARDGVEALEYLFTADDQGDARMPRVVILDLKLPRIDGFDVIARLRGDPRTQPLPVVVFSSSSEREDVRRCAELGANSYVVKPVVAEQYKQTVWSMLRYWLNLNQTPDLRP